MARFEREKKAAEGESSRSKALTAQVQTFSKTEAELRHQLNIYVEKFKQVRAKFPSFAMLHLQGIQTLSMFITSNNAVRLRIHSITAMTSS